ncbi:PH domain-containing protein [Agrilactobacillus yilanensis]|uniref:PH domain-containing protein n=1 Tax=Agrilactobacillus yilanensis TaxID=2485997 RepID=A0ABW4J8L5_9LACO|nr:PH domain-containing protein [Agrilactobacillus yilanensis]
MISKPKHQHPLALIFALYEWGKVVTVPVIIVVAVSVRSLLITVLAALGLVLVTLIAGLIDYLMFSYQLTEDEIVIREGVFVKKVNHIPYDRIQNVVANQWFFLKPFHVESIEIETAGHADGPEVQLSAVPEQFKQTLAQLRQAAPTPAPDPTLAPTEAATTTAAEPLSEPKAKPEATYQITWHELLKFAFTSPAFLSGLLAILAVYGKMGNKVQEQIFDVLANSVAGLGLFVLISIILGVLILFYLGSAAILIARFYHFKVVRTADQFNLSSGLFKTRTTTIAMDRIQAVVIKQPLLRRLLKIATVKLVVISNSKKDSSDKDVIVMPVMMTTNLAQFMADFFPTVPAQPEMDYATAARTYFYDLRNAGLIFLVIAAGLGFGLYRWPIWLSLAVLLVALIWLVPAYLKARRSSVFVLNETYAYLSNNQFFTKNRYFVPKNKIQSLERQESIWLQPKGFAHLSLCCRSGEGARILKVKYLPAKAIDTVVAWYKC